MPVKFRGRLFYFSVFGIAWFLLSSAFGYFSDMDSLPSPFTIDVDGLHVAKVDDKGDDRVQANIGPEAAVFTLEKGRLQSGDWMLGRATTENRSLLPKQVLWFRSSTDNGSMVQPVTAHKEKDSYQLKFANAHLIVDDTKVYAKLMGDQGPGCTISMQ